MRKYTNGRVINLIFYRKNSLRYLILVMMSVTSIILTSVCTALVNRDLTYKAWIPFDYSSPATFYFMYTYQLIGMSTSGIVNVACESLICGFLLHICCQFEILEHRLTKIAHDEDILADCIRHHSLVFESVF